MCRKYLFGGTGKTTLSIKINQIFKKKIKSCFVKKFYENQTDEQQLLKNGKLFLSTSRLNAIKQAEGKNWSSNADDGLRQNNWISKCRLF